MVAAVRVHKYGGPEVLTFEEIEVGAPGQGQVKVKQHACGVNFIDTYFRMGMYPSPVGLPFVAGNEGAGEVVAVGPGVTDFTVEYLVRRTFKVQKGQNVFVHAAAGGVGLILCQWANHLGANVIGTVGSKDKAALAKANGCHHTILYREEDFVARVKEITSGKLCDVVYDGVGKTTFPASLDCIRPLGLVASFGSSSGQIDAFNINILQQKGSLFATRPTLNTYAAKRDDLLAIANDLFDVVGKGAVKIPINQKYPLRDAQQAHRDLEGRSTTGSIILVP